MKTIMLLVLAALLAPGARAATEDQRRESQQEYLSGLIYYQKGDFEKARQDWQRALGTDPANKDAAAGLERIKKLYGESPENSKATAPAPAQKAAPLKADPQGIFTGYRGVSLSLPGHQVAFLKKGDYVDVMVTFDAKMADRKEKVTATILQNVRVVEVLKPAKTEERGTVQILLNPNEAQYAALSDAQGDLHIALRAPGDTEMHPMEMASFRKLFR
jgi:tetratricopeptide (TPR) repeat protein